MEVNVQQAQKLLKNIFKTDIVPFLWGPPGIGKSTIVKELAKEMDWKIIDLRLSLLNPVDLRGLPVVDKKLKKADWYKPSFLPKSTDTDNGILFLDEINLAPQSVQAAAYQLILDKKLGEYEFPKTWRIVAAGNREIDKANVFKLSAPLANRFLHLNVAEDWKIWRSWAKTAGVRSEVIDYIAMHSSVLLQMPDGTQKAFPSPRSWHFVSDLLDAFDYETIGTVTDDIRNLIYGSIGEGVGKEFCYYLDDYDLQNIKAMIQKFYDTGELKMPDSQNKRFGIIRTVFKDYRDRNITNAQFMKFTAKLSPEEKAIVEEMRDKKEKAHEKFI